MRRRTLVLAVLSTLLTYAPPARAQLALDFTGYTSATSQGQYTMGYFFDVVNPILVHQLGYFDEGKDGLRSSHEVGIWDNAGTLLASGIVSAGTSNSLLGFYRMVGIAPMLLSPGSRYVVGGVTSGDLWIGSNFSGVTGTTVITDINVTAAAWANGNTFAMPDNSHTQNPPAFYGGGNFGTTAVVATPEPASLLLLGTGLLGVAGFARRRRTS